MMNFTDVLELSLQFMMISSSGWNQSFDLIFEINICQELESADHVTPLVPVWYRMLTSQCPGCFLLKPKPFFFSLGSFWVCHRWCPVSWDDEAFYRSEQRPGPQRIHCRLALVGPLRPRTKGIYYFSGQQVTVEDASSPPRGFSLLSVCLSDRVCLKSGCRGSRQLVVLLPRSLPPSSTKLFNSKESYLGLNAKCLSYRRLLASCCWSS